VKGDKSEMATVKLTRDGKKQLENELKELKEQRVEIAERLASAREFGDLKENSEYSSARSDQQVLETRILEVEDMLKNAVVISAKKGDKVQLGAKVKLESKFGKQEYSIVGAVEANPLEFKLSEESPLGGALIGKKVGEMAVISTPSGDVEYKITEIS
jgi:transcription elongation factor GreA